MYGFGIIFLSQFHDDDDTTRRKIIRMRQKAEFSGSLLSPPRHFPHHHVGKSKGFRNMDMVNEFYHDCENYYYSERELVTSQVSGGSGSSNGRVACMDRNYDDDSF